MVSSTHTPQKWNHSLSNARTVGYRAVWRIGQVDPIALAERNVRMWLSEKLGGSAALGGWDGQSTRFDDRYSIVVVITVIVYTALVGGMDFVLGLFQNWFYG